MDLNSYINKITCSAGLKGKTKEDILKQLASLAMKSPSAGEATEEIILKKLQERESQGSTGFGNELAIPHARIPGMKDFIVCIATHKKGVDFDALDKKKVKLFFTILGPDTEVQTHLKILATLSRMLGQGALKQELLNARSESVILELFQMNIHQENQPEKKEKQKMKLLTLILYLDEFLYHIIEYFIQEGIEGATIIESSGMGQYVSNIPMFATFIGFMNEKKNMSKTIMALIPEDQETEIIKGIEEITGDLDKKQGAMIFTSEISTYKGTMKML